MTVIFCIIMIMKKLTSIVEKSLIVLTLVFLFTLSLPVSVKAEGTTDIRTADEFVNFAENCHVDSYSKGKTFNLMNDIDLSGYDFEGVPIFTGIFNGNNHTITGVTIKTNKIEVGLFGTITETGSIRDLNVEGEIVPNGIVEAVGGVASINYGEIKNCSFKGEVVNSSYLSNTEAIQTTGGIVGINKDTGSIIMCKTEGIVSGLKNTGGIAGENYGTITGSENSASINTSVVDRGGKLKDLKVTSFKSLLALFSFKKMYACENEGGIAGLSSGNIIACTNKGVISHGHNGYNVGGIVGKSSGYVYDSKNSGEVSGNSNVGGICGLLEPGVILKYSDDIISQVHGDVNTLFDMIDNTLVGSRNSISGISYSLSSLFENINAVSRSAASVVEYVTNFAGDKIEEINAVKGALLDTVGAITTGVQEIGTDVSNLTGNVKSGVQSITGIGQIISNIFNEGSIGVNYNNYGVMVYGLENIVDRDNTYLSLFRNGYRVGAVSINELIPDNGNNGYYIFENLPDLSEANVFNLYYAELTYASGNPIPYLEERTNHLEITNDMGEDINIAVAIEDEPVETKTLNISTEWVTTGIPSIDEITFTKYVLFIMDGYRLVGQKVIDVYKESDYIYSLNTSINVQEESDEGYEFYVRPYDFEINTPDDSEPAFSFEKFNSYFDYSKKRGTLNVRNIYNEYGTSGGSNIVSKLLLSGVAIYSGFDQAVRSFKNALNAANDIPVDLTSTMEDLNTYYLPRLDELSHFKGITPELDARIDALSNDLINISTSLDGINKSLNRTQGTILTNAQLLVNQASIMADNAFNAIYNAKDYFANIISDDSIDVAITNEVDLKKGMLISCQNNSTIDGVTCVGGVVGYMGISSLPEITTLDKDEEASFGLPSVSYHAVINDCISVGNIAATKDYSGLICGKQGLGAIANSKSEGTITSEGSYVGGITGLAHGLVKNCAFNGTLSGKDYIGGIAGVGSEKELFVGASSLVNNYAIVEIDKSNKFNGAISGSNIGTFESNYFYSNMLDGVNSYSLEGKYEPISKTAVENRTRIYGQDVNVRFVASNNLVRESHLNRGDSLNKDLSPSVPHRDGMIGFWNYGDIENIQASKTVEAVYVPHPAWLLLIVPIVYAIIRIFKETRAKKS